MHHTYTNILGKDRDIGYGILRMSEDQQWHPSTSATRSTRRCWRCSSSGASRCTTSRSSGSPPARRRGRSKARHAAARSGSKGRRQALKDYVAVPAARRPGRSPLVARRQRDRQRDAQRVGVHDHLLRPLPRRDARVHRGGERGRDARRSWYLRQLLGSANLTGGKLFHIMTRQPQPPDRAPPVPRPAGAPLRGDRRRGARDLRALRAALQHRPAAQAVRQRRARRSCGWRCRVAAARTRRRSRRSSWRRGRGRSRRPSPPNCGLRPIQYRTRGPR